MPGNAEMRERIDSSARLLNLTLTRALRARPPEVPEKAPLFCTHLVLHTPYLAALQPRAQRA